MQRSIVVDLPAFRTQVFEYDKVVKTIEDFSIGRAGHHTPLIDNGSLSLTKREREHRSSVYPPPRGGALMPWALFFQQAPSCAFHQGDPAVASHGCIHLIERDARWLFDWAGSFPVGLTIRGPYPASSVPPQRFYGMGAANMTRASVTAVQQALKGAGFDPGAPDGDFDAATDAAVRAFQRAKGEVEDGVVGRDTAAALGVTL